MLLLGERGVGKTAIVHGLARRIAEGTAPAPLLGTGLLSIEPDLLVNWARDRHFEGLFKLLGSTPTPEKMILFLDGAEGFLAAALKVGAQNPGAIIRAALQAGVRCIGTGSVAEYRTASETSPWLNAFFRPVFVQPMDEAETLLVVQARKGELEKFHEVVFSDEALAFAALWSGCLPRKTLELLDAAGARVKLRQVVIPEIEEVQRRLNFITKKEEDSLSNHEFEKARFFSDEARKERESLQALRERHRLSENAVRVAKQDLEDVIASWSQYPYSG